MVFDFLNSELGDFTLGDFFPQPDLAENLSPINRLLNY
jgi:hypothetical protein